MLFRLDRLNTDHPRPLTIISSTKDCGFLYVGSFNAAKYSKYKVEPPLEISVIRDRIMERQEIWRVY